MTLDEARRVLDAVRAGKLIPAHLITEALILTGDLPTITTKAPA